MDINNFHPRLVHVVGQTPRTLQPPFHTRHLCTELESNVATVYNYSTIISVHFPLLFFLNLNLNLKRGREILERQACIQNDAQFWGFLEATKKMNIAIRKAFKSF